MVALYLNVDDGSKLAEVLVEFGDVVELTWDLAHLQLSVHVVISLGKAALDLVIEVGPTTKGKKGLNVKTHIGRPLIHWFQSVTGQLCCFLAGALTTYFSIQGFLLAGPSAVLAVMLLFLLS